MLSKRSYWTICTSTCTLEHSKDSIEPFIIFSIDFCKTHLKLRLGLSSLIDERSYPLFESMIAPSCKHQNENPIHLLWILNTDKLMQCNSKTRPFKQNFVSLLYRVNQIIWRFVSSFFNLNITVFSQCF